MKIKDKTIAGIILAVGLSGVVLGFFQVAKSIKGPFSDLAETSNEKVATAEIQALRQKDTDNDGLSDFDELYIYDTSPYLADSDSDSVSDKQELQMGTDPNCPEGKTCRTPPANTNTQANLYDLLNENTNTPSNTNLSTNTNSNSNSSNANVNPSPDELPIEQLREVLLSSGVPEEKLNQISDADLREMYADALKEETVNANVNQAPANSNTGVNNQNQTDLTSDLSIDKLRQLSAAEIRTLMELSGIPADTLSGVDDETLKSIFNQAIDETPQE
ncbi:MAG: hypothetical protein PHH01_01660 [Patescibacteria group bacterium]|nr:hypothetical protein [Patescibacteria group bacterium]